jgi:hypothetical protein
MTRYRLVDVVHHETIAAACGWTLDELYAKAEKNARRWEKERQESCLRDLVRQAQRNEVMSLAQSRRVLDTFEARWEWAGKHDVLEKVAV